MEAILNACVGVISKLCRFDRVNDPRGARKKSLIILLIFVVGIQIALFWSLLK